MSGLPWRWVVEEGKEVEVCLDGKWLRLHSGDMSHEVISWDYMDTDANVADPIRYYKKQIVWGAEVTKDRFICYNALN